MEDICVIKEIYKLLYQFEKEFVDRHGISMNEAMVLCCLKDGNEKSAGEICDFVGLSNSRVSKVLCSAEDKGYIRRRLGDVDRRQMFFSLTDKGRNKMEEIKGHSFHFRELLEQIVHQCQN
jgi:DNA-binding MarR family transcriptional regulator